jgi:hypothetical protein
MERVYEARLKEESQFSFRDAANIVKAWWSLLTTKRWRQNEIVEISKAADTSICVSKEEWLARQRPEDRSLLEGYFISPKNWPKMRKNGQM